MVIQQYNWALIPQSLSEMLEQSDGNRWKRGILSHQVRIKNLLSSPDLLRVLFRVAP